MSDIILKVKSEIDSAIEEKSFIMSKANNPTLWMWGLTPQEYFRVQDLCNSIDRNVNLVRDMQYLEDEHARTLAMIERNVNHEIAMNNIKSGLKWNGEEREKSIGWFKSLLNIFRK